MDLAPAMFAFDGDVNEMVTTTVSMRLPQAEADRLRHLAERLGLDRATFMKQALRRGAADVLFAAACDAYRRGTVTLSRAAEMADLTVREFLWRLPEASLELSYGVDDLRADLEVAE